MAQHDYFLSDQPGAGFRQDVNNALAAIVSNNSGPNEPNPTYAYQSWADTTTGLLKQRNAANNGWITLMRLDGAFLLVPPEDGSITTAKLANGVLTANAAGLAKMADGYLSADAAGRAKMADGYVTPDELAQPLTLATSVASTSGTSIDFTGIPSWVKRITVMLRGVSTNGTSDIILRVGTSSGFNTIGYDSTASAGTTTSAYQSSTAGFLLVYANPAASSVFKGIATIATMGSNIWVQSANISDSVYQLACSASSGSISLGGTLDRIRITTVNGTDTFDAGSINILYEG